MGGGSSKGIPVRSYHAGSGTTVKFGPMRPTFRFGSIRLTLRLGLRKPRKTHTIITQINYTLHCWISYCGQKYFHYLKAHTWLPISNFYWHFLFHTVFEIFDLKIFRVWPWPLAFRGHLHPEVKNIFTISKAHPETIETSLYLVPFSWFSTSKSKFWGSHKIIGFQGQDFIDRYFSFLEKGLTLTERRRMTQNCASKSVQPFFKVIAPIFLISRKGSDSHQTASNDVLRVKIGSALLAAPSSKNVKSWKRKKQKKTDETLYICWVPMCIPPSGKICLKPNFTRLFRSMT